MSDYLSLLHSQAHARHDALLNIDLAVVVVAQSRVDVVLYAESRARALVLESHHMPLIVLRRVSEHKDDDAFEVLFDAQMLLL